ncbi:MAG: cupin domain-containing protein [Acidimicrobiia bacterium]
MDPLRDILGTVRLATSVFCRAELSSPWSLRSGRREVGVFHAIVEGSCWIEVEHEPPVELRAGDVALVPHGAEHTMSDRPGAPATDMRSLDPTRAEGGVDVLTFGGDGEGTRLFCGRFQLPHSEIHPLFCELPDLVVLHGDATLVEWVEASVRLISREIAWSRPGADTVVSRLGDVLVVEAIRSFVESARPPIGWLKGLGDPEIARVLGLIHGSPGAPWDAASLARAVGLSRATLFRRFRALIGVTPAAYLLRWRMHVAAGLLRDDGATVAAAARRVGYASEAGFSSAFLAVTGLRPGAYRRAA